MEHEALIKEAVAEACGPLSPLQRQQSLEEFVVAILVRAFETSFDLRLRVLTAIDGQITAAISSLRYWIRPCPNKSKVDTLCRDS